MDTNKWNGWTAREWNEALFLHFFLDDGRSGPVTRLPITDEVLQRVTGDEGADPAQVHDAFLAAIRRPAWEIRQRALSTIWLRKGEWTDSNLPPFVVYLVLTCLVAAAMGEEVRGEGEFRERLRILLKHPQGTSYPLEGLPRLWEAFGRWLHRIRESGAPVRELVLPDPGRMNRIGYSVRLAFPERRDQFKLFRLLSPLALGADPPIPTVLDLIEARLSSFSGPFQEAFTNFRRAFVRSDPRLHEYPFWAAVREATTAGVPEHALRRSAYQLFLESAEEWHDDLVLMASTEPVQELAGATFVPVEIGLGEYEYVVTVGGAHDAAGHAIRLLLHGVLDRVVPDLRSSSVIVAINQGVLLFCRDESGARALTVARPDDADEVWAVVREDLLAPFVAVFPTDHRPAAHPSPHVGWIVVSVFRGHLLTRFDRVQQGPLQGIRCLQPTVTGPQLHLSGGVRLRGAYLGLPQCLPMVRAHGADAVVLFELGEELVVGGRQETLRLEPCQQSIESFAFPSDGDLFLDGRYNLIAKSGTEVVAQRQITFRSAMIWNGYSRPTDSGRWLAESTMPDVVVPDAVADTPEVATDCPDSANQPRTVVVRTREAPGGSTLRRISDKLAIHDGVKVLDGYEQTRSDALRLSQFVECSAGWSANRKGISEADFLEWIGRGLSVESYALKFEIARAWTEGGYFDEYTQRRWRGRVYFARDPELVIFRTEGRVLGTLRGLAPAAVRNRVQAFADACGAQRRPTETRSPWLPAPLSWWGEASETFERIAAKAELGPIRWLRPASDYVAPVAAVAALDREDPKHYMVRGSLDWDQGRFTAGTPPDRNSVEVQWLWRSDRPGYYRVLLNRETFWLSHSRNWALLVAHLLAGVAPFERVGTADLVRATAPQVYLPLPLARSLACTAACSPGPARITEPDWTYAYSFRGAAERSLVLGFLCRTGDASEGDLFARRVRWLLGVIRGRERGGGRSPLVPVPAEIKRELYASGLPEAQVLASLSVPVYVVPHLRHFTASYTR